MTRPLATLADAITAKGAEWRAEMRANDIARRAPPPRSRPVNSRDSGEPDRGYIEQPGTAPTPPRRRTEAAPSPSVPVVLVRPTVAPPDALTAPIAEAKAQPEPDAPVPTEAPVPKAKAKKAVYTPEYRAEVVAAWRAAKKKDPTARQEDIADEYGIHKSAVSAWTSKAVAEEERAAKKAAKKAAAKAKRAEPVPDSVSKVGVDGRRYFNAEFREKAAQDWHAARATDPRLPLSEFARKHGVVATVLRRWIDLYDAGQPQRPSGGQPRAETPTTTLLSRPTPPPSKRGGGPRSFESVSLELAQAIERVATLKRELRELLEE